LDTDPMSLFSRRFRFCQAGGTDAMQAHGPQKRGEARKGGLNMNSNIQRSVRNLALLSVLAGTMALTTGHIATAANSRAREIQGTWVLRVSAHDCQTGAPLTNFQSLLAFAQGGTLTNVTTGSSPALRSTGLGTWEKAGDHTFTAVTRAFLFSPAGVWTATQRIANTFEIGGDPDEVTGTTDVQFFDTNGKLILTGCATVLGRRLD